MNFKNHQTATNILRFTAVLGTIAVAIYHLFSVSEIKPNQEYSFYALILVGIGALISLVVLGSSFLQVLKNPDILVPVGLYITADALSGIFIKTTSFIGFNDGKLTFANASYAAVSAIIVYLALTACFTGWMTRTLLRFVETGKVDLVHSFQNIGWWFPRTLAAFIFGGLPAYLLLFFLIPFLYQSGAAIFFAVIYPLILATAVFALIWNLATAFLIPYVLTAQTNLKESVIEGVRISWRNKAKTIVPVLLLMLTAGWVVVVSVRYNDFSNERKKFGEYSYGQEYSLRSQTNFTAEFVWVGDYQEKSKWHETMLKAVKQEPLKTVDFRIMIVMLLLSLTVNLELIRRYSGMTDLDEKVYDLVIQKNLFVFGVALIALLFPFEIFLARMFRVKDDRSPQLADLSAPKVFTDENILGKQPFLSSKQLDTGTVENVFVGDFDGKDGIEKVIVYNDKAFVYDAQENLKSEIKFNLGKSQNYSTPTDADFDSVKVIDFDGDGIFEFIGIGSYPYKAFIVDQKGVVKWEYQGEGIDIKNVEAVDIDNDKRKELVVMEENSIKIFDRDGRQVKTIEMNNLLRYSSDGLTINLNKSGEKAFLINSFSNTKLYDLSGKKIAEIKMPTNITGFWIDDDHLANSLYFDGNKFGLFDLDGNLKAKYEAPFSEVRRNYWEKDESNPLDRSLYVYSAEAKKVRINEQGEDLFAVLAYFTGEDLSGNSMLYVYDSSGKIVYQELFEGHSLKLIAVSSETRTGTDDIIILEENNVWRYSVK